MIIQQHNFSSFFFPFFKIIDQYFRKKGVFLSLTLCSINTSHILYTYMYVCVCVCVCVCVYTSHSHIFLLSDIFSELVHLISGYLCIFAVKVLYLPAG